MAQNSNIARVDQDMELPKWCQASTEASLQRFTRGHGSMVNLLNLLSDHASMEKKVSQLYEEFETKWKKRALIEIGGTIADDEVNVVLRIWMATYKEKQDQHIQLLSSLTATDGPIRSLQNYINSEEAKATREATLSLFERAKQKQAMLEKDIKQLKGNFFLAKDKEVDFKLELDAAQDDHARYGALVTRWKQLQADGERASTSYRQKLQEEKSTRTTFIEEMKRFQDESNAHERARLQQLQHVMTSVIQISKAVEIHRGERLGPLFEDGISRLEKYDFEREIALFNQLNVYQHEFPVEQLHPSEVLAKKETEEKSHLDFPPSPTAQAGPSIELAKKKTEKKSHLDVAPSLAAKAVPSVQFAKKETEEKSHFDAAPSPAAEAVPSVQFAKKKSYLDAAPSPAAKANQSVKLAKKKTEEKSHIDTAPSPATKAVPSVKLADKKSHLDAAPSPATKAVPPVELAKKKSHLDAAPSPATKAGPSVKLSKKETEKKSHLDVAPSLAAEAGPSVELNDIQVLPVTKETAVPVRPILKSAGPRTRQRSRHVRYAVPRPSDFRTIPARPGPYNPVRRRSHTVKPIVENTGSIAYFDDLLKPVVTTAIGITHIAQGHTVKVYAVKDIFGVSVNDITCKAGCKIYMTRPASSGSAFGYIKKGWLFKRKIYGYFDEQLVTILKKPGTDKTSNLMC
ncbi:uncharacterized protein LOC124116558 [Haliotis rufescens]|uniref:uncharacterized protein LOC124116558 n=1 Tax=Haliotis rufescens TaxID=6454 RepID=UPI00201FAA4A|nr:uncharacterized protein LOC124116558 [Haliotis rufescens]